MMKRALAAELKKLFNEEQYDALIELIKTTIAEDQRAFTNPTIKKWCGLRWRNIFITEATKDRVALREATKKGIFKRKDKRSDKQKVAERYLRGSAVEEWKLDLPKVLMPKSIENVTFLFAPGLINGLLPVRAFQTAFPKVQRKFGMHIFRADNHPVRGCDANAHDMVAAINEGIGFDARGKSISKTRRKPLKDVIIMGYSKGAPDTMALLVNHPEIGERVRAVFNWAGAIGGSPLADDMYETIQDTNIPKGKEELKSVLGIMAPIILESGPIRRLEEYDVKTAIKHITTDYRKNFFKKHEETLDSLNIPFFNLTGSTSADEVPFFQTQGYMQLHRYDSNNDMQVTQDDAKLHISMATDLAMLHGHHWDVSYDPFPRLMRVGPNLDHPFPKEAAVAAIIQLCAELGIID